MVRPLKTSHCTDYTIPAENKQKTSVTVVIFAAEIQKRNLWNKKLQTLLLGRLPGDQKSGSDRTAGERAPPWGLIGLQVNENLHGV